MKIKYDGSKLREAVQVSCVWIICAFAGGLFGSAVMFLMGRGLAFLALILVVALIGLLAAVLTGALSFGDDDE